MTTTRAQIRSTFVKAISNTSTQLRVFNGPHIDELHDVMPVAVVAFTSVTVDQNLSDGFLCSGIVNVLIAIDGTDDVLDVFADDAARAIVQQMRQDLPGVGCLLTEMNYQRDIDPGAAAITLSWQVDYNG